jgi:hypothetical protein
LLLVLVLVLLLLLHLHLLLLLLLLGKVRGVGGLVVKGGGDPHRVRAIST